MTYDYWLFLAKFLIPFVFALVACSFDLKERRIPNAISVVLLASGLLFHLCTGGWQGLLTSISGFAVGFGVLLILYLVGGGGAGDVKFMGGVGSWIGPYHVLFVFVMSAVLVGMFALGVLAFRMIGGGVKKLAADSPRATSAVDELSKGSQRTKIPYAVPAAAAIILRLVWLVLIHRNV
jgi:prepilin peptidase CpaA